MATQYRFIIISVTALLLLVGCGSVGRGELVIETVEDQTINTQLRFLDGQDQGPVYNVSLAVPEDWVGEFVTRQQDNTITFRYMIDEMRRATIFTVEALSQSQYWEQIGSYPTPFVNIVFTADTYFIYHMPIYEYYTGLSEDEFQIFADEVPGIVDTFVAERVTQPGVFQQ